MKRRGLILLLLSGWMLRCRLQTDGVIRRFHAVNEKMSWTEAQGHCRDQFTDLATIQDPSSNAEARQVAQSGKSWIGLYITNWKWSQQDQDLDRHTWFTSWAGGEPRQGSCVSTSAQGDWSVRQCEDQNLVSCYRADVDDHILEKEEMNWADARTYCRSTYTDLSSIRSEEDNDAISWQLQNITGEYTDPTAWIGLYRHSWLWSDRSGAPYRQWASKQPDVKDNKCVTMDASSADWHSNDCKDNHNFLCYTDVKPTVLRMLKVRLTAGSADLDDPKLQESVLQQLQQKLQEQRISAEVKLRWGRRPDGEGEEPPADSEEKEFYF
ncbi:macrophage mannose receptor 1-like isoform X1 [Scophthalmus maximus]|uniref:macrophage mannose receptor 1-like isoform X1 n=2 Tax=Scophthalmus maximus TaxID=52904 RepID=UPI000F343E6D|nr:macrophage mannose receptor 1-like isoform X1 [Scophthalmus maximus]XP_035464078.1 macrophage mannose receptor 1-like isoform X1 [Scophthalmus maximus]XP_047190998.1 macrophage mannose receptor 1-like isoform X1 [Scophthalmus maximus]XP_047190999.1 macrophage mannose receptor 1-like isoform X1 [Scophthalmus maximus]XP_047191000.1 macrophage mannose receptor 1-like isoform X1 [Scophthalmus maximus]XP_047191001.1 macrophage mannose receptor 1-like isoform X1 [Scophthalmus maximus]